MSYPYVLFRNSDFTFPGCGLVLMRDPPASRRGKTVLGTAAKASAKECALLGDDVQFIITLSAPDWKTMSGRQRTALLDHELSHCVAEEGEVFGLRGHDIEEFTHILKRHGAWHDGIREAVETLQQLDLFAAPGATGGVTAGRSRAKSKKGVHGAKNGLNDAVEAVLVEAGVPFERNVVLESRGADELNR